MPAPTETDQRLGVNVRGTVLRLLNRQHRAYICRDEKGRKGNHSGIFLGKAFSCVPLAPQGTSKRHPKVVPVCLTLLLRSLS